MFDDDDGSSLLLVNCDFFFFFFFGYLRHRSSMCVSSEKLCRALAGRVCKIEFPAFSRVNFLLCSVRSVFSHKNPPSQRVCKTPRRPPTWYREKLEWNHRVCVCTHSFSTSKNEREFRVYTQTLLTTTILFKSCNKVELQNIKYKIPRESRVEKKRKKTARVFACQFFRTGGVLYRLSK